MENKDIEQVHMNLAYNFITYSSEERYACSILNAIIGSGANSRLFMKIREEMGIAYSVYSYESPYRTAGLFHIYAALGADQTEAALEAMGREIRRFRLEGPTESEMARAKEQIKTDLIIHGESTRGHMSGNAKEMIQFGHIISMEETIKRLKTVTREEILYCMERYFTVQNMAAAFVGNLEDTEQRIKGLPDVLKFF